VGVGIVAVSVAMATLSGGAAFTADSVAAAALARSLMAEIDTRPYEAPTPTPTGRVIDDLVAYYPFEDGSGTSVSDASRIIPLAPLSFYNEPRLAWIPGSNGLTIEAGGELKNSSETAKIASACIDSNEVTVEAWIEPASIECDESAIVSCAKDKGDVNFVLVQRGGHLLFYVRTSTTDKKGNPPVVTVTAPMQQEVTHCVATFDGTTSLIYVNGMPLGSSNLSAGDLSVWHAHPLRLAKLSGYTAWAGKVFLAAIYSRALDIGEIQANFAAGPSPSHLYNRIPYDDIDDYNGYADSPPRAEDGSVVVGAEQFSRTVEVVNVATEDLGSEKSWDSTDAKRITVKVYKDYRLLATLVRARYRGVSAGGAD